MIDLVKDVSDGAVYDLDETYTESGATLVQNNLISRLEGGARIWSLGRKTAVRHHGSCLRLALGANINVTDNLSLSADARYEYGRKRRDVNGNLAVNFIW